MDGKFALVIPTLNEAGNIGVALDRARTKLDALDLEYELLVVDDNSADGTQEVVESYHRSDPRVRLVVRTGARGLAGAVLYGWARTDAPYLGVMDADLQHPPELLPKLLNALAQGKDMAIASRYVGSDSTAGWNPFRRAVSVCSTWATVPLQKSSIRVRDPLSGFFVLRRSCIDGLDLQPEGFKLLLEILVRGNIRSVAEVPYQFGLRYAGQSKANWRVGLNYLQLLGRLSRNAILRPGSSS
jgi:dolichol-phosphate mannosyltransferase